VASSSANVSEKRAIKSKGISGEIKTGVNYPQIGEASRQMIAEMPRICQNLTEKGHPLAIRANGIIRSTYYLIVNKHASKLTGKTVEGKYLIEVWVDRMVSLRDETPERVHDLIDRAIQLFVNYENAIVKASGTA
jgi:hypothetical protein